MHRVLCSIRRLTFRLSDGSTVLKKFANIQALNKLPSMTGDEYSVLFHWIPAMLQDGTGLLSVDATKVRILLSATAVFFHACFIVTMQRFQHIVAKLADVHRLWKYGRPNQSEALDTLVASFIREFHAFADHVGASAVFPKLHELRHVAHDLREFGCAIGYSSGILLFHQCYTFDNMVWLGCLSSATYESTHKEVKAMYERLSRKSGTLEAELFRRLLRAEFFRCKVNDHEYTVDAGSVERVFVWFQCCVMQAAHQGPLHEVDRIPLGPRRSTRSLANEAHHLVGGVVSGSVLARSHTLEKSEQCKLEALLSNEFSGKLMTVMHPKDALTYCTRFYNNYFVESSARPRPNYFKLTGLLQPRSAGTQTVKVKLFSFSACACGLSCHV